MIMPECGGAASSFTWNFPTHLFLCLSDPVPGACSQVSNLGIDPNLYVHYNLYETFVTFAPANLGYER